MVLLAAHLLAGTGTLSGQGTGEPTYRVQLPPAGTVEEAGTISARLEQLLGAQYSIHVDLNLPDVGMSVGEFQTREEAGQAIALLRDGGFERAGIIEIRPRPKPEGRSPLAVGEYEGYHGNTTCDATFGWVWLPRVPERTTMVELYDGDRLLAKVPAELPREDLSGANKGTGRYGFHFSFDPDSPKAPKTIEARIAGIGLVLPGSPRPNPCVAVDDASEDGAKAPAPRKSLVVTRVATGAVKLDGRLDDEIWKDAVHVTDFQQKGLDRGFERPEWTSVALLYDDEAIYVGARLNGPEGVRPDRRVVRRDHGGNSDRILISLDTYADRRTAYTFGVTSGGVRLDYFHADDQESPKDDTFDPVWEARTTVDSLGWSAEMRIPFSQLRFRDSGDESWGVNVRRWHPRELMNLYWVVVPMAEQGWSSRFGSLEGLDVRPTRRAELTPYALAATVKPTGTDGDEVPEESTSRFGGDLKLGLGPTVTLDATVNPDFGQIEADPAEVNLTAFETAFVERRPFFVEGNALFEGPGPRYFYSRRIGAIPHGTDPGNALEMPVASRILGASKVTGRLDSGLSIGGLAAVTSTERALVPTGVPDETEQRDVAPTTGYGVVRLQQEVGESGSLLGVTFTGVERSLSDSSVITTVLASRALTGGADWSLRFADGAYQIKGHAGYSQVSGEPAALSFIQRSSAHYYQRPDADHVEFDPDRTSLEGYAAGVSIAKIAGTHWTWEVGGSAESPGFDVRDAGIMRSADDLDVFGIVGYRQVKPGRRTRNYRVSLLANASWNFGGVRQFLSPGFSANLTLLNFWRTWFTASYEVPSYSDELTRGGPLVRTLPTWNATAGLTNSFSSRNQWSLSGFYRGDQAGGYHWGVDAGAGLRLGSHVGLSINPGYSRGVDTRHYYGALPGGPEATFGQRQIFSFLERSELYAQARLDFAFTPDVTLELYAEPFASSGRYYDFGELEAARGDSIRRYEASGARVREREYGSLRVRENGQVFTLWPTPFNIRSFRSNAVLRWEWSRGSTVFLIWQQNRWGWEGHGELVEPVALGDALKDAGENVLTLKVSYRLGTTR